MLIVDNYSLKSDNNLGLFKKKVLKSKIILMEEWQYSHWEYITIENIFRIYDYRVI